MPYLRATASSIDRSRRAGAGGRARRSGARPRPRRRARRRRRAASRRYRPERAPRAREVGPDLDLHAPASLRAGGPQARAASDATAADAGASEGSARRDRRLEQGPRREQPLLAVAPARSAGCWRATGRPPAPGATSAGTPARLTGSVQRDTRRSSPSSRRRREDGQGRGDQEVDLGEDPLERGLPLALGQPRRRARRRRRRRSRARAGPARRRRSPRGPPPPGRRRNATPRPRGGGRPASVASSHPGTGSSRQSQPARCERPVDGRRDGRVGARWAAGPPVRSAPRPCGDAESGLEQLHAGDEARRRRGPSARRCRSWARGARRPRGGSGPTSSSGRPCRSRRRGSAPSPRCRCRRRRRPRRWRPRPPSRSTSRRAPAWGRAG